MARRDIRIRLLVAALTALGVVGLAIVAIVVCLPEPPDPREYDRLALIGYPYVAAADRREEILKNFHRVTPGMTGKEVEEILGEPDALRGLYESKMFRPKRIGWTVWYYLEKNVPDDNLNAKVVRISFDLDKKVTAVDHWGFE